MNLKSLSGIRQLFCITYGLKIFLSSWGTAPPHFNYLYYPILIICIKNGSIHSHGPPTWSSAYTDSHCPKELQSTWATGWRAKLASFSAYRWKPETGKRMIYLHPLQQSSTINVYSVFHYNCAAKPCSLIPLQVIQFLYRNDKAQILPK